MPPIFTSLFVLLLFCKLIVAIQVKTKKGILEGVEAASRNGTRFYAFYSVPFAKAPVNELRFAPPKEIEPWEGVLDASSSPPACLQIEVIVFKARGQNVMSGEEDCLYLNVFTPNVTSAPLLPVMVFIHAGAFHSGATVYFGPDYFMDHPVVLVTIQYRLNVLGFLSANDEILPGNNGMKDQVMALKWVKENIGAFGGDPKRVTIFGESAGGASVDLHLHSPMSSGLFHQAIIQSGTALSPWVLIKSQTAAQRTRALGVLMGCPEQETKLLLECLRTIPAEDLVKAHYKFFVYDFTPVASFGPVLEPKSAQNAFLVEDPWKQPVLNSVPLIIGIARDEGVLISARIIGAEDIMDMWNDNYDRIFPLMFSYFDKTDSKTASAITESIKKFYFGNKDFSLQTRQNATNLFTDGLFSASTMEAALRYKNKMFYYLFAHANEYSLEEFFGDIPSRTGVAHGDDVLTLFYMMYVAPMITAGPDLAVSQRLVTYWVNFAAKGDPNGKEKIWQPFGQKNLEYLHIRTDSDVMQEKLLYDKYVFWRDTLYARIYK